MPDTVSVRPARQGGASLVDLLGRKAMTAAHVTAIRFLPGTMAAARGDDLAVRDPDGERANG